MSLQSSILTFALALVVTCMPLALPANAAVVVGGDYAGADLSPSDGDILSGTFTNVGMFPGMDRRREVAVQEEGSGWRDRT